MAILTEGGIWRPPQLGCRWALPRVNSVTVLETYATAQQCQSERNRIGFEMAAAYPNDRDFVIACQLNPRHQL
jgi:hypothetical protein